MVKFLDNPRINPVVWEKEFAVDVSYRRMDLDTIAEEMSLYERLESLVKRGVKPKLTEEQKVTLARVVRQTTNIYFIATDDMSRIKIGKSSDVKKRFASIRTMSPVNLNLECHFKCHEDMEYYLHGIFSASRSHGEWFNGTADPYKVIEAAKSGGVAAVVEEIKRINVDAGDVSG